ncbi:hypothetical protein F444_15959 [Phytophthora nicotianae P1976]|uniref:Uncharacterized protein n=1 Tax=Phytophthora nicotianae P1976 TaxID=1317066 RepID=A0A080ZK54_PHYNI|nr:hypothetical protein F444_15959 [Phytophthora nicotianae P1976]
MREPLKSLRMLTYVHNTPIVLVLLQKLQFEKLSRGCKRFQGKHTRVVQWSGECGQMRSCENLDRSTWEEDIQDPPNATVERLLRAAGGEAEVHLANLSRSARLAPDVVSGAIADNRQLKNDWEAFGRRLGNQENVLKARRDTLEGFLEDIPLPAATDVTDPESTMENVPDTEHEP